MKPVFKSSPTQFQTIIFASLNGTDVGDDVGDVSEINLTERQCVILDTIRKSPTISGRQMSEMMSVSQRTIEREISLLKKLGVLRREGNDKDGMWVLNE